MPPAGQPRSYTTIRNRTMMRPRPAPAPDHIVIILQQFAVPNARPPSVDTASHQGASDAHRTLQKGICESAGGRGESVININRTKVSGCAQLSQTIAYTGSAFRVMIIPLFVDPTVVNGPNTTLSSWTRQAQCLLLSSGFPIRSFPLRCSPRTGRTIPLPRLRTTPAREQH